MDRLSDDQFQGVHMNDVPIVEDLLTLNILLYDIDFWMGALSENLLDEVCRNAKNCTTAEICYVNNIHSVFQYFRCPNCDTFFNRTFNLEQHLTTWPNFNDNMETLWPHEIVYSSPLAEVSNSVQLQFLEHKIQMTISNLTAFDYRYKMAVQCWVFLQIGLLSLKERLELRKNVSSERQLFPSASLYELKETLLHLTAELERNSETLGSVNESVL